MLRMQSRQRSSTLLGPQLGRHLPNRQSPDTEWLVFSLAAAVFGKDALRASGGEKRAASVVHVCSLYLEWFWFLKADIVKGKACAVHLTSFV